MCNLSERLENYVNDHHNVDLTYGWNGQKGEDVDTRFREWNKAMYDAKSEKSFQKFMKIIADIFNWGGVGSDKLKRPYAEKLWNGNFSFESTNDTPLSSWSKVLAAYTFNLPNNDNGKFFIYDSRVAVALNIIAPEYKWFLPEEYGHSMVFALIKSSRKKSEPAQESYQRYCQSLRQQGGVALERQLFMLGKILDFRCKNWRKCIFVNSDLANQ